MVDEAPGSVEREVRIAAPPAVVFDYLVDPSKMLKWLGQVVELEPRPGGLFRVDVNGRDIVRGTVVEIVPHQRLVVTWGWEGGGGRVPPGSTTVVIVLEPDGDGTIVRLSHRNLRGRDREVHGDGWQHYLGRLAIAAGGGDPGPDPLATTDIVHGLQFP